VSVQLRVDPILCDGFGYCAELLPELVALDEWGYPVLAAEAVPGRLLDLARRAVADCPRRALLLVDAVDAPARPAPRAPAAATRPRGARVKIASTRR
jgi:ferredoxin